MNPSLPRNHEAQAEMIFPEVEGLGKDTEAGQLTVHNREVVVLRKGKGLYEVLSNDSKNCHVHR